MFPQIIEQIHYPYCKFKGAEPTDWSSWSQAIICTKLFLEMKESLSVEDDYLSIYLTASHCCHTCPTDGTKRGKTQVAASWQHCRTGKLLSAGPSVLQHRISHIICPLLAALQTPILVTPWVVSSAYTQSQWAWEIVVENTDSSTHKLTQVAEHMYPSAGS